MPISTWPSWSPSSTLYRFGYEGEIFLIVPVLVLDCDLSDIVGRWLGLSMEGLNHSSAERSTRDHCQPDGDMPINHVPPDFTENAGYCSRPAPAREDYENNQLGLVAGARLFPQPDVVGVFQHRGGTPPIDCSKILSGLADLRYYGANATAPKCHN